MKVLSECRNFFRGICFSWSVFRVDNTVILRRNIFQKTPPSPARNQIHPGIIWVTSAFQARDPMMIGGDFLADRDDRRNEELKRNVVEKMWLNYYNNVLLAQGLITESMHHKMKVQISTRKPTNRVRDTGDLELR